MIEIFSILCQLIIFITIFSFPFTPKILNNSIGEEVIINQVGSSGVFVGRIDFNFTNNFKFSDKSLIEV